MQWLRIARKGEPQVKDIAIAPDGSVFLLGHCNNLDIVLGPGEPTETSLPTRANFLAKYDADGNFLWVVEFDPSYLDVDHLSLAADGSIYATGYQSYISALIEKRAPSGELLWRRACHPGRPRDGVAVTPVCGPGATYVYERADGHVLWTGPYAGGAFLESGTAAAPTALVAAGAQRESFVAEYDASGVLVAAASGLPAVGTVMDNMNVRSYPHHSGGFAAGFYGATSEAGTLTFFPGEPGETLMPWTGSGWSAALVGRFLGP
jgi:hypothetical protein